LYASFTNPSKQFTFPLPADKCTHDEHGQRLLKEHPLEHRLTSARLLMFIRSAGSKAASRASKINVPVLFQLSGDDTIVRSEGAKKIFKRITSQDKELIEYPQMYHCLSLEKEREKVFADTVAWMEKHMNQQRPSF